MFFFLMPDDMLKRDRRKPKKKHEGLKFWANKNCVNFVGTNIQYLQDAFCDMICILWYYFQCQLLMGPWVGLMLSKGMEKPIAENAG